MAVRDVADRAAGYGMPGVVVDGSDVLACYEAMRAFQRASPYGLARFYATAAPDSAQVTTEIDASAYLDAKLAAMRAHATQITVDAPFFALSNGIRQEAFGVEVLDGIGSSEAYHIYISSRPGRVRPGSVGEVVPGYRARVLDDEGREVPDGEVGTLWIEGETAALLYWDDHEKSKRTFHGDLVDTGDLFVRDGDGFFWYRGRSDELIKVGGIWVAPSEVEHCLVSHADVVECAVVGYEEGGLTLTRAHVAMLERWVMRKPESWFWLHRRWKTKPPPERPA